MLKNLIPVLPYNLKNIAQYLLFGLGILGGIFSFFADYSGGKEYLNNLVNNSLYINSVLHLILVFLVIIPGRILPISLEEKQSTNLYLIVDHINNKFLVNWNRIWITWGLYYIAFFSIGIHLNETLYYLDPNFDLRENNSGDIFSILRNVINYFNNYFFLLLYLSLTPSVILSLKKKGDTSENGKEKKTTQWFKVRRIIRIFFGILIIVTVFIQLSTDNEEIAKTILIGSGVLSATIFGLLVGRLDSHYLLGSHSLIILLFFYASIQVFTIIYDLNDPLGTAAMAYFAFSLKCIFYIYVSKLFEKKTLLYYFYKLLISNEEYFKEMKDA